MSPTRQIISSPKAPAALGSYSQAVRVGDTVYLSGQIGTHPETKEFAVGVEAQIRQVLDNLGEVLNGAGLGFEHVVKTMVLLTSIDDLPKVNAIYREYFKQGFPARTAYQVVNLPFKALVEIEAIAVAGSIPKSSL